MTADSVLQTLSGVDFKKVVTLIFALGLVQFLGSSLSRLLDQKSSALFTGFLSGLVSSTATTTAIARKSKSSGPEDAPVESITFLAATLAMLLIAVGILAASEIAISPSVFLIVAGPLFVSVLMIYRQTKSHLKKELSLEHRHFEILEIIKLSIFIIAILLFSKILQKFLNETGITVLTFVVSLFEMHASVISNLQLYNSGTFDLHDFRKLLMISIVASYLAKGAIVAVIGGQSLKRLISKQVAILIGTVLLCFFVSELKI